MTREGRFAWRLTVEGADGEDRTLEQRCVAEPDHRDQRHHDVRKGMMPHRAPERAPLDDGRRHIFLAELVDHEAARHAGDVGEREIAENTGRKDQMSEGIAEHVPFALQGAVDQDDPGMPRHDILIGDIEAARPCHPVQLAVEDEETDETEPENRLMGETRDDLGDRISNVAGRVKDAAIEAGRDVKETVRQEIDQRAPEVTSTLREAAEHVKDQIKDSATAVAQEAKDEARRPAGRKR